MITSKVKLMLAPLPKVSPVHDRNGNQERYFAHVLRDIAVGRLMYRGGPCRIVTKYILEEYQRSKLPLGGLILTVCQYKNVPCIEPQTYRRTYPCRYAMGRGVAYMPRDYQET